VVIGSCKPKDVGPVGWVKKWQQSIGKEREGAYQEEKTGFGMENERLIERGELGHSAVFSGIIINSSAKTGGTRHNGNSLDYSARKN